MKDDEKEETTMETTSEERIRDERDFPIVPRATVVATPRALGDPEFRLGPFRGEVLKVYQDPKHGGVVQYRDFDSLNIRTVRAEECRVQGNTTIRSKALHILTTEGRTTVEELMKRLDCTAQALAKALKGLEQEKKVRSLYKGGEWEIV